MLTLYNIKKMFYVEHVIKVEHRPPGARRRGGKTVHNAILSALLNCFMYTRRHKRGNTRDVNTKRYKLGLWKRYRQTKTININDLWLKLLFKGKKYNKLKTLLFYSDIFSVTLRLGFYWIILIYAQKFLSLSEKQNISNSSVQKV